MNTKTALWVLPVLLIPLTMGRASSIDSPVEARYHLIPRPWTPASHAHDRILDTLEGLCRFSVRYQDSSGAIVDPLLRREIQYSTPYFAYAVGTLVRNGHAMDLLPHGIAAMEHSTRQFQQGDSAIPDRHGEFFIAALTESLDVYRGLVPKQQYAQWRNRLTTKIELLEQGPHNNWMTYAMKGEWLRYRQGLVARGEAVRFIERCWKQEQAKRIADTRFHLYHDFSSDPDTLSVEVVGRGNLLALVEAGYDGPSAAAMRSAVLDGTRTALYLQDPEGQLPANGRTDDHVWADVGDELVFQVMANRSWVHGNKDEAAAYQEASDLVFEEIQRWRHCSDEWNGSFFITKNHFDPILRVGYQDASHVSNYTGSLMFHLAEVYNAYRFGIPHSPTPSQIGGYSITLDPAFDSVIADAGGMQVQINLRGQTAKSSGNFWTPLGIVRFARAGWDTRLGPSDGALTDSGGATFAPEFFEAGRWHRLADLDSGYRAEWHPEYVHPALIHGTIDWHPLTDAQRPSFKTELWITPDGVYTESTEIGADTVPWGLTWPLLINDGRPLVTTIGSDIASTAYSDSGDRESFLSIDQSAQIATDVPTLRSSYGDLLALRLTAQGPFNRTFIYPHNAKQPSAEQVQRSMRRTKDGFQSVLGLVKQHIYVGRTIAGGEGTQLTLIGDEQPALTFERRCGFLVQIRDHRILAIETNRDVTARVGPRILRLKKYRPKYLQLPKGTWSGVGLQVN